MNSDRRDDGRSPDKEEIPRQGFWAALPKRTLSRVVILLAALAGIVYLRQRTGLIAGCMADGFRVSPGLEPTRSLSPLKARVLVPPPAEENGR